MKNFFWLIIIALLVGSCSKKENTLLNTVDVYAKVNPETFVLTPPGSNRVQSRINNSGMIYGFSAGYYFSTPDFFNTFKYYSTGSIYSSFYGFEDDGYYDGQNILAVNGAGGPYTELKFDLSTDYGQSFQTAFDKPWDDAVWGGANNATGENNYFKTCFFTPGDGYVVSHFYSTNLLLAPSAIRVYRYQSGTVTFLSTFGDFYYEPSLLTFRDKNIGYMVIKIDSLYPKEFHLFKTTDGGYNWMQSGVLPVDADQYEVKEIQLFDPSTVVVKISPGYNNEFTISHNDGASWTHVDLGTSSSSYVNSYQCVSPTVIMALVPGSSDKFGIVADLFRITDFETSTPVWTKMNQGPFYGSDIFFLNENTGLAMDRSILQITTDGGKTWKLLLFPDLNFH
jgi:hypothetical protein